MMRMAYLSAMTELQHIIPRPAQNVPGRPYKTPEEHWEEVTKEIYGSADLPQTIHFDHDPQWDSRFWSIQNAHDQFATIAEVLPIVEKPSVRRRAFGFWSAVGLLMFGGDLLWLVWRLHL